MASLNTCFPEPEVSGFPIPLPFTTKPRQLHNDDLDVFALDKVLKERPLENTQGCVTEGSEASNDDATLQQESCDEIDENLVPINEFVNGRIQLGQNFEASILSRNGKQCDGSKRKNKSSKTQTVSKKIRPNVVTVVDRVTPKQPPNDNNEYRVIRLSNGLQAVLMRPASVANFRRPGYGLKSEVDSLMESYNQQKLLEKQKYLPPNFPLVSPFGVKKFKIHLDDAYNANCQRGQGDQADERNHLRPFIKQGVTSFAVVVNVGLTDDPNDCLGLAHFTEHMVHYGSKKYPPEDFYFNFALNHGLGFNAFTENHTTTYYNTIEDGHLDQALDMMVHMLAYPSFNESMTCREVNAVDSEFHLKRHFDILRRWFLFQTALKNDHPLRNFGFGNEDTLLKPKNIHTTLRNFHSKYYVSNAMTVGIQSSLSLEQQEELVLKHFSQVPEGERKCLRETKVTNSERQVVGKSFNCYCVIQGLCSFSNLWIVWPIPDSMINEGETKTLAVVSSLLRDESEGSLAHYLASEGYIWLMLVPNPIGQNLMDNKYTSFLSVDMFLTDKGMSNHLTILQALHSYISQLLKAPQKTIQRIFDEMKIIKKRDNVGGNGNGDVSPIMTASALQYVNPDEILMNESSEWETATFCYNNVKDVLKELNQDNMIVIQTIPKNVKLADFAKNEKVFIAPYTNAEFVVQARFPNLKCNNFTFNIGQENLLMKHIPCEPVQYGRIKMQPLLLPNVPNTKVVSSMHLGNAPGIYKATALIVLISPSVSSTARNFAMTFLWTAATMLSLLELLDKSNRAGLNFAVLANPIGIIIMVTGYPENLLNVLNIVTTQLLTAEVSERKFQLAIAALEFLSDLLVKNNHASITEDLLHFMICNHYGDVITDAISHIKETTVDEVNNYSSWFKRNTFAIVRVAGNLPLSSGDQIAEIINKQEFSTPSMLSSLLAVIRNLSCSLYTAGPTHGEKCIRVKSDSSTTYTTTVNNFYYVGKFKPAKFVLWNISLRFFESKAFHYLRAVNQLGYAVHTYYPTGNPLEPIVIGVGVTATASKHSPCEIDRKIDKFMVEYGKYLDEMEKSEENDGGVKQKLSQARQWYISYFGSCFASNDEFKYQTLGISKLSIQILGKGAKECKCDTCAEIIEWKTCNVLKHLQFAKGKCGDYYVDNPKYIRD